MIDVEYLVATLLFAEGNSDSCVVGALALEDNSAGIAGDIAVGDIGVGEDYAGGEILQAFAALVERIQDLIDAGFGG